MPPREPAHRHLTPVRPRPKRDLTPVDERLVMPEGRFEIIDGRVEHVAPADEPHGTRHSKISALLEAYAAPGYEVASDMLTRTSARGDMAPDASVYPAARDPVTGGRQLEELAFEVLSTERLGHAAKKARALAARGVRRVFAVDVERQRALAWSRDTNTWAMLPPDGTIEDPALALPLPIHALVVAAKADDAIAAALIAKKNPVIEEAIRAGEERGEKAGEKRGEKRGKKRGLREGKIESILAVLAARGVRVSERVEKLIRKEKDEAEIDQWIRRAGLVKTADELFHD